MSQPSRGRFALVPTGPGGQGGQSEPGGLGGLGGLGGAGGLGAGAVTEEAWQHQRVNGVTRAWGAPYLPGDPLEFMDGSRATARPRDAVPLPEGWVWLNDWSVEPVSSTTFLLFSFLPVVFAMQPSDCFE